MLHIASLKDLTLKLVMLIAITTASRVQSLHLLTLNGSKQKSLITSYLEDMQKVLYNFVTNLVCFVSTIHKKI
jgi:hypothetical protein